MIVLINLDDCFSFMQKRYAGLKASISYIRCYWEWAS